MATDSGVSKIHVEKVAINMSPSLNHLRENICNTLRPKNNPHKTGWAEKDTVATNL
ncbi:predicted protein [Botrytis cinerea T4]|uniref:Uncharacterized protein n=1 Tax=Botryotinia fuckeliana (strain T4) TaxID=999810 RepID=G2XSJ1_BOTF4|nr:predicted protein [Botrytis cinerea T4]